MKELTELALPDAVRYTRNHEWARPEGDVLRAGITDYAQDRLGDVVYVELPPVGAVLAADQEFGTVESVKAVSELFLPVAGEIAAVNGALEGAPQLVNESPYGDGWMVEVKPADPGAWAGLLSRDEYRTLLGEEG
ncbi:MAG: glycine cleavage system protein GcvH [Deferrisomatales bacterium]|nr:glycine cleavage system protein GcvH [Deferrisomatales bacterium]